jgi:hypothetical protein
MRWIASLLFVACTTAPREHITGDVTFEAGAYPGQTETDRPLAVADSTVIPCDAGSEQ